MNKLIAMFDAWYFDIGRTLGNLNRTMAKLDAVAAHHAARAKELRDAAAKAQASATTAEATAAKANLVKTNISSLLGETA